jgi:hypothetical protein
MVGQRMAAVNPDAVSGTAGLLLERASMRLNLPPVLVTRGLDPRVHFPRKKMDCRVKTGNDEQSQSDERALARLIGLTFVSGDSLWRAGAETACHRISGQDPPWHLPAAFLYTSLKAHRDILRMEARLFCRAH